MRQVLIALTPGIAVHIWCFGIGIVIQLTIGVTTTIACEAVALRWRRQAMLFHLLDGSAMVLAVLTVLAVPPYVPWWLTVLAIVFAQLIAKHAYGGLGQNVFNPAMAGYAFVLVCFPTLVGAWPSVELIGRPLASITQTAQIFFTESAPDALSGATRLDYARTQLDLAYTMEEIHSRPDFMWSADPRWLLLNIAFLCGGAWMCWRGTVPWRIPVACLVGLAGASIIGAAADSSKELGLLVHLFSGATMLGAFFVATDPVTAASSPRGMLIYGAGVGVLIYFIRVQGVSPDGVAFAVLTMNALAPLIDRGVPPRHYGAK